MNVRVFLHSLQHLLLVVAFRPHNSSPANAAMMPAPSRVEWHVSGREEWRAVSVYISIHVRVLLGDEVRVLLLVHVGVSTGNVRQLCSFYCPSTRVGGSLFVPCSREGQAKSRVCQSVQYGRFDNLLILPPFERKRFDNLRIWSYRNPSGPIVSEWPTPPLCLRRISRDRSRTWFTELEVITEKWTPALVLVRLTTYVLFPSRSLSRLSGSPVDSLAFEVIRSQSGHGTP
jgi:hypothetical protein